MEVRVTKRAQRHIDRAALWWDENRPLAPEALDEELAEAFSLLSAEPGIGAPALNVRAKGVKRVHLARVHYYLYYRVRGGQVEVQQGRVRFSRNVTSALITARLNGCYVKDGSALATM